MHDYLRQVFLRIRPEKISWLKFILEGYDGLATISTVRVEGGLVALYAPDSRYNELMLLLEDLADGLTPLNVNK